MPPLNFSSIYGSGSGTADATAQAGFDAVVNVGGSSGESYEILEIIASYPVVGTDYDDMVGANGVRSFIGRLSVLKGPRIVDLISVVPGFPNPSLFLPYNRKFGEVIFDVLINEKGKNIRFNFPSSKADNDYPLFGSLRAEPGICLNVVLLAGSAYTSAGVPGDLTAQQLHVVARPLPIARAVQIGPFHTVG